MLNFIAHGDGGPRTEVDVLGVRFPYSRELIDDTERLQIPAQKIDIVFAESKKGTCSLNGPWGERGSHHALEYVLRRVGVIESDDSVSAAAGELYSRRRHEGGFYVVRIICLGSKLNDGLRDAPQILWPDALSFMNERFRNHQELKAEHQTWDPFGKYLWDRLSTDGVPDLEDFVAGWQANHSR